MLLAHIASSLLPEFSQASSLGVCSERQIVCTSYASKSTKGGFLWEYGEILSFHAGGRERWEEVVGLSAYFHVSVQKLEDTRISEFEPGLGCCCESKYVRVEG